MSKAPSPPPADAAAAAAVAEARPPSLREWVRTHDESWIFVILYLGMAVGLSVFVSLFWLVLVAGLHFALEVFRQQHYREGGRSVFLHALWEIKLDVGLVLLALMLVLYIEVVLGILGVQSAARAAAVTRAGTRIGTRAAAWERNLRTFLLTFDEMIRIGHAGILMNRRRRKAKAPAVRGAGESVVAASGNPSEVTSDASSGVATDVALEDAKDPAPALPADGADPGGGAAGKDAASPQVSTPPPPPTRPAEPAEPAKPAKPATPPAHTGPLPDAWSIRWKTSDRIGVALVVMGVLFIVAAPLMTPHDWASAAEALAEELRPFPGS